MTAQFLAWWRARSLREQRMLLIMFAFLAATILWFGIYRPLQDALSRARERHQEAVIRLGEVRAGADALRRLRPASLGAPLATAVTQAASDAGFANATVAPQSERRVAVAVPSARPASFLAWIAALEARGIVVERVSARANSDRTLAVDAILTGGG